MAPKITGANTYFHTLCDPLPLIVAMACKNDGVLVFVFRLQYKNNV